jgi:ABC-type uncharacterized transport system substrate-binding protein
MFRPEPWGEAMRRRDFVSLIGGSAVVGLQQLGWADGHNVRIDTRWGAGNADDIRKYAAELSALAPDVMVAVGTPAVGQLLQATKVNCVPAGH